MRGQPKRQASSRKKAETGALDPGAPKSRKNKGDRGGKKGKPSRQELGRQVSEELSKLRPVLKDVAAALSDRLDGELVGLAQLLETGVVPDNSPVLPPPTVLSAMLADIHALKVKAWKGRVKDLGRIERLLESLIARMPPPA